MNDKGLLEKLNKLKEVKLDSDWKCQARDVLFSQISNSVADLDTVVEEKKVFWLSNFLSVSYRPAGFVLGVFALFIFSVIGVQATAKNVKPGNHLYAARVLSEKAQVAMTFDQEKKEKLNVKLAGARAKEITEVLSNTDLNKEENKKKAEKLSDAFKNEISTVKNGLENLNLLKEDAVVTIASIDETDNIADEEVIVSGGEINKKDGDQEVDVDNGESNPEVDSESKIDLSEESSSTEEVEDSENISVSLSLDQQATTTPKSFDSKLSEAENSFVAKDFVAAKQILEQVNILIEDINKDNREDAESEEVESETEAENISEPAEPEEVVATTTAEIIENE